MAKTMVLFSGGLDSTVLLTQAVLDFGKENVEALSVYYGQKHDRELTAAAQITKKLGVTHLSLDLANVLGFSGCALLKGGGEIEDGTYTAQLKSAGIVSTYVPFRNGLMLSAAASVAMSRGAGVLLYGAHTDDATAAYPDCTREFFTATADSIRLGTGGEVILQAPFIDWKKKDIVALGIKNNAPMDMTWSCYRGGALSCGKCATCLDRLSAFKANKAVDPLEYQED